MRDDRLDYIKGLAIALVLGSHLMPISVAGASSRVFLLLNGAVLTYGYFFSTLGVPLFFLVSSTLYYYVPPPLFGRRLCRLSALFLFWVAVQYIAWVAVNHRVPNLSPTTIRLGGPSLVGAQATVFYFLFDAFVLMLIAAALSWSAARDRNRTVLCAWVAILGSGIAFWTLIALRVQLPLWAVANFLPYVALPFLFAHGTDLPDWKTIALLALSSALAEGTTSWLLNGAVFTMPNYARTSTILGAVAVFLLIRKARHLPGRRLLALLGRFSLGFYALHTFFQFGLRPLFPPLVVTTSQGTVTFSLPLSIATLAATAAAIWVLSRTPLRRFVM